MKSYVAVPPVLLLLLLLAGCGGGTTGSLASAPASGGSGRATVTIAWPARTRLVPAASNSIAVVIRQGMTIVAQQTPTRPAAGEASTVNFPALPTGSLSVTATAYPNADGTGVAQATATLPLVITAGQNTSFSLTMNSTIDHLDMTAVQTSIGVGSILPISATGKDSSGAVVLLFPAKLTWQSAAPGIASVDANGLVTGIALGSADISVTDTESGKTAKTTVTVVPGIPSNPFLADGFAYPVGGPVANQNGGTGPWGGPWNEYGQGYTSSVIGSGSLSFGRLAAAGNSIVTTSDKPVGHARAFQTSPGKTGGVLFISYLVKPLDALNVGYPNTYFELVYGGVSMGKGGGSGFYGLENSGGGSRSDSRVPVVTNQTAFLVERITFGPVNGNDTIDLFVNPVPGQPLPALPDATKSDRNTGMPGDFNFGSSIRCQFDEVRFGHTFPDVAPTG